MANLLIVEDSQELARFLERAAELGGHRVVLAGNGREALDRFAEGGIDLMVLDLVMPEMDGLEALDRLRKMNPSCPVLAISGGGRVGAEDYLRIAAELGAERTLAKPFTAQQFLSEVDALLES